MKAGEMADELKRHILDQNERWGDEGYHITPDTAMREAGRRMQVVAVKVSQREIDHALLNNILDTMHFLAIAYQNLIMLSNHNSE